MLKSIALFIFCLSFTMSNSQENKLDFVSLKYHASPLLYGDVDIIIDIIRLEKKVVYNLNVDYYEQKIKVSKKIKLNDKEFNNLLFHLTNISSIDLIDKFSVGLDGPTTTIEMGSYFSNSIKYELWGVHKSQINTSLKDFILAVQKILQLADIRINDYN